MTQPAPTLKPTWKRTIAAISWNDGKDPEGNPIATMRDVHAWQDAPDAPLLITSLTTAKDDDGGDVLPPASMSSNLMITHRASGRGAIQCRVPAAYIRQVLPKLLALPLPWAADLKTVETAFHKLSAEDGQLFETICKGDDAAPSKDHYDFPIGVFSLAAFRDQVPAYNPEQRVKVLDEVRIVTKHRTDGEHPFGANLVRLRAYLAACPKTGTVTSTVQAGDLIANIRFTTAFGGTGSAVFKFQLKLDPATARAASAIVDAQLEAEATGIPARPILRVVSAPREEVLAPEPTPARAPVAKPAPRVAKPAAIGCELGMDTKLAVASEVPCLAGWTLADQVHAFGAYRIGPVAVEGSADGWCWYTDADATRHLKRGGVPFTRPENAVFAVQCSKFPEWKTGSFDAFLARATG